MFPREDSVSLGNSLGNERFEWKFEGHEFV